MGINIITSVLPGGNGGRGCATRVCEQIADVVIPSDILHPDSTLYMVRLLQTFSPFFSQGNGAWK